MSALSMLQEQLAADGLLQSHQDLARKVAEQADRDDDEGRDDDASAKRRALRNLGYNDEGLAMCEHCHALVATQEGRLPDVVALCDECYGAANADALAVAILNKGT
jgi:hypothetical protein